MSVDVKEIAGRLTEAQRREVIRGSIGSAPMPLVRRLIAMCLMHIVPDSPDGRYGPCRNTDLGLAVRDHLLATEPTA